MSRVALICRRTWTGSLVLSGLVWLGLACAKDKTIFKGRTAAQGPSSKKKSQRPSPQSQYRGGKLAEGRSVHKAACAATADRSGPANPLTKLRAGEKREKREKIEIQLQHGCRTEWGKGGSPKAKQPSCVLQAACCKLRELVRPQAMQIGRRGRVPIAHLLPLHPPSPYSAWPFSAGQPLLLVGLCTWSSAFCHHRSPSAFARPAANFVLRCSTPMPLQCNCTTLRFHCCRSGRCLPEPKGCQTHDPSAFCLFRRC